MKTKVVFFGPPDGRK